MVATHIIKAGVVVNTIVATVAEAQAEYPDAVCMPADTGGIGWLLEGSVLVAPPPLPDPRPEAAVLAQKIEALWQAADRYVTGYISGVAIGILTIGVLQEKPKALAVTGWSNAVWTEYYIRKAAITATSEVNHDFTSFGPMPHSVPELQAEIGL